MLRKFFTSFDIFPANANLRTKGSSDETSVCTGILSLIIYMCFVALFIKMIVDIALYKSITTTVTNKIITDNNRTLNNFQFAIGFIGYDLTKNQSIFTIRAFIVEQQKIKEEVQLDFCTTEILDELSQQQFNSLGLSYYMCPVNPEQIYIRGFIDDSQGAYLTINIYPCDPIYSSVTCSSEADINLFVQNQGQMVASFIPITTGFNPTDKEATFKYAYQDSFYMTFTKDVKSQTVNFVETYEIKTDQSALPFSSSSIETGKSIEKSLPVYILRQSDQNFFTAYLFISPSHTEYQRVFGKLQNVLSYLGGLFAIFLSFFATFLASYNQYKYELKVADNTYSMDEQDHVNHKSMNFLRYVKYTIYDWIKVLGCYTPQWQDCKSIQEARQQINSDLQASQLLRRINNLQKMVNFQNQQKDMDLFNYMVKPNSIKQNYRAKIIKQYVNKVMQHQTSITINQLENNKKKSDSFQMKTQYLNSFNSINLVGNFSLQQYLKKYSQLCISLSEKINLQEQDYQAQKQIHKLYLQTEQDKKKAKFKDIPIVILYRISNILQDESMNSKKNKLNKKSKTITSQSLNDKTKMPINQSIV